MAKRIRAVAITIKDGQVLLMHRRKNGREYYVFPGGGVEVGETVEQAVVRELIEEASMDIVPEKLLYRHIYDDGTEQFFYLCRYVAGEPKLGEGNESRDMATNQDNYYNPIWHSLEALPQLLLYPLEIRDWLMEDLKNDFESTPKEASLKVADLRQSL